MIVAREDHSATLLGSGDVLFAAGSTATAVTATAELYRPKSGTFVATGSLIAARTQHTGTLLGSGEVMMVAGSNGTDNVATAELYDPTAGTFSTTSSLATARSAHTATLLHAGKVVVAGGSGAPPSFPPLASAELSSCTPLTACPVGDDCGKIDDGCGGKVQCGPKCTAPETCGGGGKHHVCGS